MNGRTVERKTRDQRKRLLRSVQKVYNLSAAESPYKLRCDDFRLQHAPAKREMDHGEGDFPIQFCVELAAMLATMIRNDESFVGYRSQLFLLWRNKHKSCQSFWE